ncbi:hypothetical protein [Aquimarina longa]|uniref:hypothetical protein n=1 Tax=Aquimarina longa TaxID=1080221 RepID=UPI0011DF9DF5|nr:hypothetical protein [Aquimarina longa]
MSKRNKLIFSFSIVFMMSCNSSKEVIKVSDTNHPVILRLNKKYRRIFRINLPIEVTLNNNSFRKKIFINIDYSYHPYREGVGEDIYVLDKEKLIKLKNNKTKILESSETTNYVIYSWYRLDSTKVTQDQFKSYIEKMLSENKDTLHIGTVTEFKQKHAELFEKLTKNDSISIQFLDGKKLGERITVPVEW